MSAPAQSSGPTVSTTLPIRSRESLKESQSRQARFVRCGLFGASTYHTYLPDAVFKDYMQFCQEYWAYGATKTLIAAQRVVAAAPDFSWGWSGVANGFMQIAQTEDDSRRSEEARAAGLSAGDKAC